MWLGWEIGVFWWDFGFFLVGEVCFKKKVHLHCTEALYLMKKGAGDFFFVRAKM